MQQKDSAEKDVRDIRRKARRKFSAEEKIRRFNGPRSPDGIHSRSHAVLILSRLKRISTCISRRRLGKRGGRTVHPSPAYSGGLQPAPTELEMYWNCLNWLMILGFRA